MHYFFARYAFQNLMFWLDLIEECNDSMSLYQNRELNLIKQHETVVTGTKNVFLVFGN